MSLRSLRLFAAITICLSAGNSVSVFGRAASEPLFFTPAASAVPQVMAAIKGAKKSIHMEMFRISEPAIIEALIAAHKRGVDVQIIVDQASASKEKPGGAFATLTAAKVKITKSSQGFSLTHTKAFVVDGDVLYIMTLNLTRITKTVRDVGFVTSDPATIGFFNSLFKLDLKNAAANDNKQPAKIPDNIILSPGARPYIEALIKSARQNLRLVVENLSDETVINALIQAHKDGAKVQVLLPRCDMTANDFDMPAARTLSKAGVDVRMMPAPMTEDLPYIHQKSIIVDSTKAFLGSENYSLNSLDNAREMGIVFTEIRKIRQITEMFDQDFSKGLNMKDSEAFACPARTFAEEPETI